MFTPPDQWNAFEVLIPSGLNPQAIQLGRSLFHRGDKFYYY